MINTFVQFPIFNFVVQIQRPGIVHDQALSDVSVSIKVYVFKINVVIQNENLDCISWRWIKFKHIKFLFLENYVWASAIVCHVVVDRIVRRLDIVVVWSQQ